MPVYRVADFDGDTEEQREEACFKAFTKRQIARLAALTEREDLDNKLWPSILLEPMEYKRWIASDRPVHGKLHDDIEIMSTRNKTEREEHKKANQEKGKSLAKRAPIPVPDESAPPVKKPAGIVFCEL